MGKLSSETRTASSRPYELDLARRLYPLFASPWLASSDNERDRPQPVVFCWKRDSGLGPARAPAKATHRALTMQAGRPPSLLVGPWMSAVITVVCSSIERILSAPIA